MATRIKDRLSFSCGVLKLRPMVVKSEREKRYLKGNNFKGLRIILYELQMKYNVDPEFCEIEDISKYDILLISLTSYIDVWNLLYTFKRYHSHKWSCKIIIGGAAVVNIKSYMHIGDFFVYGRGEKSIHDIIDFLYTGQVIENNHIYIKSTNLRPIEYSFRIAEKFYNLPGRSIVEQAYGCNKNCFFCQYTNMSRVAPEQEIKRQWYRLGHESNLEDMVVKDGRRYTTAIDGINQHLRFAFNKKIKDSDIINLFHSIPRLDKMITLKIFNICGYPTESNFSFDKQIDLFRKIGSSIHFNKVQVQMLFTPFTPEPCTPAEFCEADIFTNYREYFQNYPKDQDNYIIKDKHFELYVNHRIPSGYSLLKRMIINRYQFHHSPIIDFILTDKRQRDKNVLHAQKLDDLFKYFNLDEFYTRLRVGDRSPFQEITSHKGSSKLIKESERLHQNLFCPVS